MLDLCLARACRRVERAGLANARLAVTFRDEAGRSLPVRRSAVEEATPRADVWSPVAHAALTREPVPLLSRLGVTLAWLVPADQLQAALF